MNFYDNNIQRIEEILKLVDYIPVSSNIPNNGKFMNNTTIAIISGLLILLGTLGAVLPFLPGLPVAWVGLLIYSIWGQTDVWGLVIFGILVGLTMIVDIFAPAIAAKGHKYQGI